VLLFILALCIAALVYDYRVAKPGSEAAHAKLEALNLKHNETSRNSTDRLTPERVHQELGRKPTRVEVHPTHTIEYYCWWGRMPLLAMRRHYKTVVYLGNPKAPRLYSHYLNETAPLEAIPIVTDQQVTAEDLKIVPQQQGEPKAKAGSPKKGTGKKAA
jgi:hypothetical protein